MYLMLRQNMLNAGELAELKMKEVENQWNWEWSLVIPGDGTFLWSNLCWWSNASPIAYHSFLWKEVDKGFLRRQNRWTLTIFLWKRSEYLLKIWKIGNLTGSYWSAMHDFSTELLSGESLKYRIMWLLGFNWKIFNLF